MYAQLLEAVLVDETEYEGPSRSAGPLAELNRLRHVMEKHSGRTDPGWALQAVADQLAYDAALVRLARRRGITTDSTTFVVPGRGRAQLEQELIDKGVNLPAPEAPSSDPPDDTG